MTLLTNSQVKRIRNLYSKGKISYSQLAAKFSCGKTTIADVVCCRTHENV